MKRMMMAFIALFSFAGCANIPKGVVAVTNFDAGKYVGKWYEIARFDFRFERNLNNTTAEYTLNENGTIRVVNRGYDTIQNEWKLAEGKAKLVGKSGEAMLKVSFFGPFYAGYNVIALDSNYQTALVAGDSFKYLWILSRTKTIDETIKLEFLKVAEDYGFETKNLIWVKQDN